MPEISHLHKRMPVILKPSVFEAWLDAKTETDAARELLQEHRDAELVSYRVGRAINSNRATGPELIDAI